MPQLHWTCSNWYVMGLYTELWARCIPRHLIPQRTRIKPMCFRVEAVLCQVIHGLRGNASSDLSSLRYYEWDSSPASYSPTTVPSIYKLAILSCFRSLYPKCTCLKSTEVVEEREKLQCDSRHNLPPRETPWNAVPPRAPALPPRKLSWISHMVTSTISWYS